MRMEDNYKEQVSQKKIPYKIVRVNEEKLEELSEEEKDKYLKERKDGLLELLEKDLEKAEKFNEKVKIESEIQKIKEAYEQIETAEKRKIHNEQKQKEEEKENEKVKAKIIEEKYSHANEYNEYLINDVSSSDHKSLQSKIVEREKVLSSEYSYDDKENRQLKIRQTAQIWFQNWTGVGKLFTNEYKVKRVIDGEEVEDTVYANLSSIDLSINEKTGEPIDPDYYDCFINKLLAEETIAGSKYNGGFIGGIEQDQEKNYYITLEKERLSPMEQEQMTAVIIMKQRERTIKEKGEENVI